MTYVSLPRLNELRFAQDPQPMAKLWRWCREAKLPARKVGGEWFVDLDAFDRGEIGKKAVPDQGADRVLRLAVDKLRRV